MTTTTAPRILSVSFDVIDLDNRDGYTRDFVIADPTEPDCGLALTFRYAGLFAGSSLEDEFGDEVEPADYGFEDIYEVDELTAQAQRERADTVRAFLSTSDVPADVAVTVLELLEAQRV